MEASIQKVKELSSILQTLQPIKAEFQLRLDKKFRMEFNFNSNHIEGNTLTYGETELLLIFDKTDGTHELREYEEMKAHDVAFNLIKEWAADPDFVLAEINIKQLNEIILVRPFWKEATTPDRQQTRRLIKVGTYKEQPNSVRLQNGELFEYASPMDTPIKMGELMQWYKDELEKGEKHPVALAAEMHHKFVLIHPFDDGNGRISRLLMNYILLKNNLPPIIIKTLKKKNYLNALNQADTGNMAAFVKYVAEQLIWSLNISIKAAKGERIDEVGDIDKRLALIEMELAANDPDNDIRLTFNKTTLIEIYKTWFSDLLKEAIPAIQKFNRYFNDIRHSINIANGYTSCGFNDEDPDSIISKLGESVVNNEATNFNTYQSSTTIYSNFGAFKKGGLKTFNCNYSIEITFYELKYAVSVDEFIDGGRSTVQLFERLLHQPVTEPEIKDIVNRLTETILSHIEFNTKKNGLR